MEDTKNQKYDDGECSFVVEVQPEYQSDEADGNKGSTDDVRPTITDQQALVHREEAPDDRASGKYSSSSSSSSSTLRLWPK